MQVYDLPVGFMSEKVARAIGNYIGEFCETDLRNFDGMLQQFMRLKVLLDINKPIPRKMKIKKDGGSWIWIRFKYEHLPTICFFCGIIGHQEKFCEKSFDRPQKVIDFPYGVWLRTRLGRQYQTSSSRWLRYISTATVQESTTAVSADRMVIDAVIPGSQPGPKTGLTTSENMAVCLGQFLRQFI